MSEMMERVQEAIRKEIGTRHHGLPKGGWDGLMKQAARAAIEAMREPDDDVRDAICKACADYCFRGCDCGTAWNAGIDEALK